MRYFSIVLTYLEPQNEDVTYKIVTNSHHSKSSSNISLSKMQMPLPCLTPNSKKVEAKNTNSKQLNDNPFMKKVKIHNNFDKRTNFKLRSANPSYRRRKHMGYLKTDNSKESIQKIKSELKSRNNAHGYNLEPNLLSNKLKIDNPMFSSLDVDNYGKHSLYANKS